MTSDSPRDERWIQHHGKIDNGELARSSVGEHCISVAVIWAHICRHRVGIKAVAKAASNVAAEPIGQHNCARCRRHRNCGDFVAAELPAYLTPISPIRRALEGRVSGNARPSNQRLLHLHERHNACRERRYSRVSAGHPRRAEQALKVNHRYPFR